MAAAALGEQAQGPIICFGRSADDVKLTRKLHIRHISESDPPVSYKEADVYARALCLGRENGLQVGCAIKVDLRNEVT